MLTCKALVGKIKPEPINDPNELEKTDYHCYIADFKDVQSNYIIFFKADYVLPYYLVEYN